MSARWVWFASGAALLGFGAAALNIIAELYQLPQLLLCMGILVTVTIVLAWQAVTEYLLEVQQWQALNLDIRQRALARTPQTMLAEAMRQMHPSGIELLKMYGRTNWMILPGAEPGSLVQWVLYGTQVTYPFIGEFIRLSNDYACVSERMMASEGAKKWAPVGMEGGWCTDREQYQQLIAYLYGMGRITMAHGNLAAQWIPPWNPHNLAETMGIKFEEDEETINE